MPRYKRIGADTDSNLTEYEVIRNLRHDTRRYQEHKGAFLNITVVKFTSSKESLFLVFKSFLANYSLIKLSQMNSPLSQIQGHFE